MKLRKIIINIILSICSIFLIFKKIDAKKITFISLESNELVGDFKLISKALAKTNHYKLHYILVKFDKTIKGNLHYLFSCIKQLFAINTSKLVILDYNNYVVSNFKRKGVNVLQLWHSSGAIKKFGNDVERDYRISNYDYVIANCDYFVEPFAGAFGVTTKQVKVTGIPKTDRLFDQRKIKRDQQKMKVMFPQIKGKKVVLYAPTFRGKLMQKEGNVAIQFDMQYLKEQLGDDYVILYKMHPLVSKVIEHQSKDIICCNNMSIKMLFSVCDYMISDYSAIIIDYSVFIKPVLFYVPDLEEYRREVGLYVDYEKVMPGPICYNEEEIVAQIKKDTFDLQKIRAFRDTFFKFKDGASCKRVVALIDEIMGGENE